MLIQPVGREMKSPKVWCLGGLLLSMQM